MAARNVSNRPTQKPSARRPGRLKGWGYLVAGMAGLFAMSVGLIFAYDLVTQMDYFAARGIDIVGNRRLAEQEILRQAGLRPGINIFSVNLFLARKRLQAHPWVASANVVRRMPDGLTIRITEHIPLALIDLGRTFILNTKGEIFEEKAPSPGLHLPVVRGLAYFDIQSDGHSEKDPFNAVLSVLRLGQNPETVLGNPRIRSIQVDRQLGLTLYPFGDTAAIHLGYSDYPEKYRRLEKVLAFCRQRERFRRLHFIDVNNVNRIVVHPVGAGAAGDDKREA